MYNYNILITGGCGFIGSNFCVKNCHLFNKMVIVDELNYAGNIKNIEEILEKKNVVFLESNILDLNLIDIFDKYEINFIINFAAQTHVDNSYYYMNNFVRDNILTIYHILDAIRYYKKNIKLIHFSTDEIYGESIDNVIFTEKSNFNPTNPYSASKASAEMIINSYKLSFNMEILIIRCNNVFGIRQHNEKVIPKFILNAINNSYLNIHGDGNKIRDFIHTDDVNSAIIILMTKGEFNSIYNIGINNPIKILDLGNYIINKLNKGYIKFVDDRPFNDYRYNIDYSKLLDLGWRPNNNFYQQLDNIIEWTLNNQSFYITNNKAKKINFNFFSDKRGSIINIKNDLKYYQTFISKNKKNVLRGIHVSPYDKYLTILSGKIIDYVIYFDNDEINYDKFILDSNLNNSLFIPKNCGHLFITLEEDTNLLYQLCGFYNEHTDININYKDPFINLDIIDNNSYIISEKDTNSNFLKSIDYVLLGSTGFLGNEFKKILIEQNKNYISIDTKLENYKEIKYKLVLFKPKYLICAAGISGRPTIAWCEDNKEETFKTNVIDILNLCEITKNLDIKLVIFGSGSIYNGMNNDNKQEYEKYTENSVKNKNNNIFYLKCRNTLEDYINLYKNVLYLRIQYPICNNNNKKCFIQKMLNRLDTVDDIYINITYVSNLFPLISKILENNLHYGILNFVNPEPIKIEEILKSYLKKNNLNYNYKLSNPNKCCGLLNTDKLYNLFPNEIMNTKKIFNL